MNREEAIKIVKSHYPANKQMLNEALEFLIPELKESEDERIRRVFRGWIYTQPDSFFDGISKEKMLAWLEKQGESKSYWKPSEEQYEALVYAYNSCSDTERGNYYEGVLGTLIEDLHSLDEQHPKFRIGDTIKKKSTGDIVTISAVDLKNREYRLSNTGFIPFKYEYLWELIEIEPKPTDNDNKGESEDIKQQLMSEITDLATDYIKQKSGEWSEEDEHKDKTQSKQDKLNITIGTKIRSKAKPDVILTIISDDCHEDEFECSNGSVLSLKQIEKYYERIE